MNKELHKRLGNLSEQEDCSNSQCFWNKEGQCIFQGHDGCILLWPLDEALELYHQVTGERLVYNQEERKYVKKIRQTLLIQIRKERESSKS